MLRRLKVDVAAQLPPKRRQVVRLPHPKQGGGHAGPPRGTKRKAPPGSKLEKKGDDEDEETEEEGDGEEGEGVSMSIAHRTALAKLPHVIEWLVCALGGGGGEDGGGGGEGEARPKFIVFAHHKYVMIMVGCGHGCTHVLP